MLSEAILDKAVKELFDNIEFKGEPKGLYDPLRYMIEIGGKRIRPRLCLLTYSLYKDTLDEGILSPASGLEIFHSFTLIHDDIMDKSPLRRSKPTVWKKWSDDTAVLSPFIPLCIADAREPREDTGTVIVSKSPLDAVLLTHRKIDVIIFPILITEDFHLLFTERFCLGIQHFGAFFPDIRLRSMLGPNGRIVNSVKKNSS